MKDELRDILKQATELQSHMREVQKELDNQVIVGVSGGGLVRVTMNGRHDVTDISIDESLMGDREVLEDLMAAAINNAVQRVDDASHERIVDLAGGMNLPMANWLQK